MFIKNKAKSPKAITIAAKESLAVKMAVFSIADN
jgi:hypothetical protein